MQNSNRGITKIIAASSVGTLIEWYDFYIFGSLATVIANQFFPKTNPTDSTAVVAESLGFSPFRQPRAVSMKHAEFSSFEADGSGGSASGSKSAEPIKNGERVGRNDPCPCGSGKKYKKCHGIE